MKSIKQELKKTLDDLHSSTKQSPPEVGSVWRNPRGRKYKITRIDGQKFFAIDLSDSNPRCDREDYGWWALMCEENGWWRDE